MLNKIKSTQNAALNGVKVFVYGQAGVGKTSLVATAPAPILLSAESGELSLRRFNLPMITIGSFQEIADIYKWLVGSHEAQQFQTICLDSISEIGEVVLNYCKANTKDARQAYGNLSDIMAPMVRSFRDIKGKHVYVTAKLESSQDEVSGITRFTISMPGRQMSRQLPYMFDEVFAMRVIKDANNQDARVLQTQPCMQYDAKDRSGSLARYEQPNLGIIFDKIMRSSNEQH